MTRGGFHISEGQRRRLHALFNELGVKDRGDKMLLVNHMSWVPVTSTSELSKDDTSNIIDRLIRVTKADDPAAALAQLKADCVESKRRLGHDVEVTS